jgi:ferritin-like metal-binding protein YciE
LARSGVQQHAYPNSHIDDATKRKGQSQVADLQAKDLKLIQYLNEAYGKEKQLETALTAHIQMTTRAPYKKRLQQHLQETKRHAREVERRIKKLGGTADQVNVPGPDAVTEAATGALELARRGVAALQGPVHVLRGTGEQEKLLKNAKTEFQDEAEEIATYLSIEHLATVVGDRETAQLAKRIRRDEERMRDFLGRLIPQLTKSVATEEIPAAERRTGRRGGRRASSRRSSSSSRSSSSRSSGSRRGSSSSRSSSSRSSSGSGSRSGGSRSSGARSGSSRSSGTRSSGTRSSGSRSSGSSSRSSGSRSGGSRSSSSRSSSGSSRSSSSRSGSSRSSGTRSSGARSGSSRSSGSRSGGSRSSGSRSSS